MLRSKVLRLKALLGSRQSHFVMQFPRELICEMMKWLPTPKDLLAFGATCKEMNVLSKEPCIWLTPKDLNVTPVDLHEMARSMQKPERLVPYGCGLLVFLPRCGFYTCVKTCGTPKEMLEVRNIGLLMEGGRASILSNGKEIGTYEHAYAVESYEESVYAGDVSPLVFDKDNKRFYCIESQLPTKDCCLLYRGVKEMTPEIAAKLMIQKRDWVGQDFCHMYMLVGSKPIVAVYTMRTADKHSYHTQQWGFRVFTAYKVPLVYGIYCNRSRHAYPKSTIEYAEKHGLGSLYAL